MIVKTPMFIRCDLQCGATFGGYKEGSCTVKQLRQDAKYYGWKYIKKKDYCRECANFRKKSKVQR